MSSPARFRRRVQELAGALRERVDLLRLALDLADRVGDGGPGPDRVQPGLLAVEPAAHAAAAPVPQLGDEGELLGHVGHDPLGRVGRGRGAQVRHVVEQRGVLLVPDGRSPPASGRPPPRGAAPRRRTGAGLRASPPPLAITITSTSGSASSFRSASMTSPAAYGPWTADCSIRNRTAGQRRCAFCTTSRSAADSRPHTSPMTPGRKGSARFRSAEKRPSAASCLRSLSSRASSSPMPTARISSAVSANEPLVALKSGLTNITTRAPSLGLTASKTCRVQITCAEHRRDGVPEGEEDGVAALLALGDLPLDPDPAEPADPPADSLQHGAHRNRCLRGRLKGHVLSHHAGLRRPPDRTRSGPCSAGPSLGQSRRARARQGSAGPERSSGRPGAKRLRSVSRCGSGRGGYASDSILAMRRSNMLITSARAAWPFSYSTSWVSWATERLRSRARSDATVDSS